MSGRVVVGIDGSDTSRRAAAWAAREARLRGAKLEIASAWQIPSYGYASAGGFGAVSEEIVKGLVENAEAHLAAAIRAVRAEAGDVEVETIAAEGQAVSQQCAQHASCPVVIVRHTQVAA